MSALFERFRLGALITPEQNSSFGVGKSNV